MKLKIKSFIFIIFIFFIFSCKENYYPKPHGYLRTDFPKKKYRLFDSVFPYTFEIPVYSKVVSDSSKDAEEYWADWQFPKFNATVYLSYKNIKNNLDSYEEDTRELAYKHSVKADAIETKIWENDSAKVYGILYDIKGDVASQIQFYLTDSTQHFVRGAFYFNNVPNKDSLAPALKFLRKDIDRMIQTFKWKDVR
ncbi:MAG: gliding motility lipoprotein GldD [Bacteroidales bacterium]|nr:gliding motility lipoprotein GldD [Bacteroidales bacterium]